MLSRLLLVFVTQVLFFIIVFKAEGEEIIKYGNNGTITPVAYSFTEKQLIIFDGKYIKLIDDNGNIEAINEGLNSSIYSVNYDKNTGKILYVVYRFIGKYYDIGEYDLKTKAKSTTKINASFNSIVKIKIAPDNLHIIFIDGNDRRVNIIDAVTGNKLKSYDKDSGYWAYDVFFDSSGKRFVASQEKNTYVYDLTKLEFISSFKSHSYINNKYFFINDSSVIALYDNVGNMHSYYYLSGEYQRYINLRDLNDSILSTNIFKISGDSVIASVGYYNIYIININNNTLIKNIDFKRFGRIESSGYDLSSDSVYFFTFTNDNIFLRYDLKNDSVKSNYFENSSSGFPVSIDFTKRDEVIFSISANKTSSAIFKGYKVYESNKLENLITRKITTDTVNIIQFLQNDNQIAVLLNGGITLHNIYDYDNFEDLKINDIIKWDFWISGDKQYCSYFSDITKKITFYNLKTSKKVFDVSDSYGFYFSPLSSYFIQYSDSSKSYSLKRCDNLSTLAELNVSDFSWFQFSDDEKYFYYLTKSDSNDILITFDINSLKAIDTLDIGKMMINGYSVRIFDNLFLVAITNDKASVIVYEIQSGQITNRIIPSYTCEIINYKIRRGRLYLLFEFDDHSFLRKTINGILSVNDNPNKISSMNIYPNPASNYIEINVPRWRWGEHHSAMFTVDKQDNKSGVRIFDLLGVEVLQGIDSRFRGNDNVVGEGAVRIDVSGLLPGVYFVRVGNVVKKFVKL